jgi:hypothetical protein
MTCTIEKSDYQDGLWIVRVYIQNSENHTSTTHHIEGDGSMTQQAIKDAILAFY